MRLDMRVLEHLGIRLYSNVAAVLSELVANSWDADSSKVSIEINGDSDSIVIRDDGSGMTVPEVNARFLTVGYEKRKKEGVRSPKFNRPFMGRKGIGKLSVFSIAEEVCVYTAKNGERNAFKIVLADLEKSISDGDPDGYHPTEIPFPDDIPAVGTTMHLTHLVKKRTGITVGALRKRLARRFGVIGAPAGPMGSFDVIINGAPVGHGDRDDIKSLEYLWEFGDEMRIPSAAAPKLAQRYLLTNNVLPQDSTWVVKGWFGTAFKPADLEPEEAGSLKNIIVLARGRLIQESILDKLGFNRIFGSYVTGQIEADFLDADAEEDIATSDRQRLVEDDPRVIALREFIRKALLDASDEWSTVRKQKKADDALTEYPALRTWVDELPNAQRAPARSLLGLIEGLALDDEREDDRKQLFRSGVLAFERLRLKEAAHQLENLKSLDSDHLLPLLVNQDYYEAALYGDIIRSRIEAIRKFKDLTDEKAKEKVLQEHLFNHLWLLDASWERATGSETMEHNLKRDFPAEFAADLTTDEKRGRIDIKYRSTAGVHIIVELKKYERRLSVDELRAQGMKYRKALLKLLTARGDKNVKIEIVFVLGRPIESEEDAGLADDYADRLLRDSGMRVAYYDGLIESALAAYGDYLAAHTKLDRVEKILTQI